MGVLFSDAFAQDLLKLIFNGTAIANIADNAASSPKTQYYAALHTADPGAGGDQTTSEVVYTSYARVAVARSTSGWTVSGTQVVPASDISFAKPTGAAGQTITFGSIGYASAGSSRIIVRAALVGPLVIAVGNAPRILRGSAFTLG